MLEIARDFKLILAQAAQTLFVIYIRDSIALRFKPFKAGVHMKAVFWLGSMFFMQISR